MKKFFRDEIYKLLNEAISDLEMNGSVDDDNSFIGELNHLIRVAKEYSIIAKSVKKEPTEEIYFVRFTVSATELEYSCLFNKKFKEDMMDWFDHVKNDLSTDFGSDILITDIKKLGEND